MSVDVYLAIIAAAQAVLLALIAAWQAKALREMKRVNGSVSSAIGHFQKQVIEGEAEGAP